MPQIGFNVKRDRKRINFSTQQRRATQDRRSLLNAPSSRLPCTQKSPEPRTKVLG